MKQFTGIHPQSFWGLEWNLDSAFLMSVQLIALSLPTDPFEKQSSNRPNLFTCMSQLVQHHDFQPVHIFWWERMIYVSVEAQELRKSRSSAIIQFGVGISQEVIPLFNILVGHWREFLQGSRGARSGETWPGRSQTM